MVWGFSNPFIEEDAVEETNKGRADLLIDRNVIFVKKSF